MLRQHGRLGPGVAVPPALARSARGVRVPPRGCSGIAAALAHPHILPKAHARAPERSLGPCASSWRGGPAPSGARWCPHWSPRGITSPCSPAARGGSPPWACPESSRRWATPSTPAPWHAPSRAAEPDVVVNELTSLAQTANPLAVKRGFDTTSRLRARGFFRARRGGPRRGHPPRRRAEHLVRLPAGTRRAHRGRPAVDRGGGPDRKAHRVPRHAGVGHARRPRRRGRGPALRLLLRPGHVLRSRRTVCVPDRQAPAAHPRGRRRPIRARAHRRRRVRHRCGTRGPDRHLQRRRRRAGPGIGVDAAGGPAARGQATAPRARSGGAPGRRAVPRLPHVRPAGGLQRAGAPRARVVTGAPRLARRAAGHPHRRASRQGLGDA